MDDLFRLVKSLQKSEKRFFRLYAGRHVKGDNNSIRLFDGIAAQTIYDERELKKKFAGTSISKHFAFNKQYLYRLLLKSLHGYYSHASTEEIIREQIHFIKILFDRRLLDACEKLINRTLALAKKHEAYPELIRLWEWKMEMTAVRLFRGHSEKDLLTIEREMKNVLRELSEYMSIYLEQRKFYFQTETRGILMARDHKVKYKKMAQKLNKTTVTGFRAKLFKEYYGMMDFYLSGNMKISEISLLNILRLMDDYPHIVKENPQEFQTTVYNYGVHKLYARDYIKAQEMADRLRHFTETTRLSPGAMQASLDFHAILQLGIFHGTMQYREAEKYFSIFREKQKKFAGIAINYSRLKVIYYIMSRLCFNTEHHQEAIRWLSHITSVKSSNERTDLDNYARIMQMLSFFVTGKTYSLEALSRAVRKSLSKNNNLFRIERLIVDFVSRNNKHIHNTTYMKEQYLILLKELKAIEKNGTKEEKLALEYIDLIRWTGMQLKK